MLIAECFFKSEIQISHPESVSLILHGWENIIIKNKQTNKQNTQNALTANTNPLSGNILLGFNVKVIGFWKEWEKKSVGINFVTK